MDLNEVKNKIKPDDSHFAISKLLCVENTHDGKVLSMQYLKDTKEFALENNLSLHLDGARVFNAVVSLGVNIQDISDCVDSMSICLSKGLGAPIGSLLVGSEELIQKARRYRKMLGGGIRQSGYLAAAGSYALDNHIKDLEADHINAKKLSDALKEIKEINVVSNNTNMLFIEVNEEDEENLLVFLKEKDILISGYGQLRIVTHRDISEEDIDIVINAFQEFFKK